MGRVAAFLREESGEDLIEYGMLAAFAGALVTAVLLNNTLGLRGALLAVVDKVVTALGLMG